MFVFRFLLKAIREDELKAHLEGRALISYPECFVFPLFCDADGGRVEWSSVVSLIFHLFGRKTDIKDPNTTSYVSQGSSFRPTPPPLTHLRV